MCHVPQQTVKTTGGQSCCPALNIVVLCWMSSLFGPQGHCKTCPFGIRFFLSTLRSWSHPTSVPAAACVTSHIASLWKTAHAAMYRGGSTRLFASFAKRRHDFTGDSPQQASEWSGSKAILWILTCGGCSVFARRPPASASRKGIPPGSLVRSLMLISTHTQEEKGVICHLRPKFWKGSAFNQPRFFSGQKSGWEGPRNHGPSMYQC